MIVLGLPIGDELDGIPLCLLSELLPRFFHLVSEIPVHDDTVRVLGDHDRMQRSMIKLDQFLGEEGSFHPFLLVFLLWLPIFRFVDEIVFHWDFMLS